MVEYSKSQLRIAALLVKGGKTMGELRSALDVPLGTLEKEVAGMIKLKVVEKAGYPTKYYVADMVRRGIMGDSSEKPFKAHAIIEGQSRDKAELVKAMQGMVAKLKSDKLLLISDLAEDEPMDVGEGVFSSNFECDVSTRAFEDIMYFVLHYGPTSIELVAPKEFQMRMDEAQGIIMDVATTIHSYISIIAQLKVAMQESNEVYIKDPKSKI
jgi:hypothetical protein